LDELGRRAHVETHQFKGCRLLHEGLAHLGVRLADHSSKGAFVEFGLGVSLPCRGYGAVAAAHGGFKLFLLNLFGEEFGELNFEVAVDEAHVGKTKLENDVAVVFDQVLDRKENGLEAVLDYILAHVAALGNGNRVSVNHAEALLEDRALRLGGVDLLFARVTDEVGL
jgi:hypothetical protein